MELKKAMVGPLGTNVYIIISNNEGIIIDPGAEANKILALAKGVSIKYILLTHNHWDHTDALEEVKSKLGVKCGIHTLDKNFPLFDFEFSDGDIIKFGEASLKVIHTPGHTPGSCCFLVETQCASLLISGDTVFLGGYGRTDLGGGSERELYKSIERIMKLPQNTPVYPGHGPATTVSEIELF